MYSPSILFMRFVYLLLFLTTVLAHAQSALKFGSGDSLTFILNSGSMYSGNTNEQLLFVRKQECVEVSYFISSDVNPTPALRNKINISWKFLQDTLKQRLKNLRMIEEVFTSHSHANLCVYNNGKRVTIKDKNLKVMQKGTKSKSICMSILGNQDYIGSFFNTLVNGFKNNNKASCNYREQKNMPELGEH